MRPSRWISLLVLLVAPLLVAGCAGPQGAEATEPTGATGTTPSFRAPAGFQLDGPTITPLDGRNRSLREDDGALVRYTLRQPADAPNASTALVSFLLNGEVDDVETVTLAPGESKGFERRIDAVRNLTEVRVEVRAGSASGKATAPVTAWPRVGELLRFDDYFMVNVENWTADAAASHTVVHVTVTRGGTPFHEFRAHLLCLDEKAGVKSVGVSRPELQPQPGASETLQMTLPLCGGETYGVDFKAEVGGGETVYGRVLFVPKGWTPPAPAA